MTFKRECLKLKNDNNRGNQVGGGNAPANVYAVGHAGTTAMLLSYSILVPIEVLYPLHLAPKLIS
ncbi:hypothetical protein Tco_1372498, partial [Tanacetum coccineum]